MPPDAEQRLALIRAQPFKIPDILKRRDQRVLQQIHLSPCVSVTRDLPRDEPNYSNCEALKKKKILEFSPVQDLEKKISPLLTQTAQRQQKLR